MNVEIIWKHYRDLQNKYSDFTLSIDNNRFVVRGKLHFYAQYEEYQPIEDIYDVEILLPTDYPKSPPVAREIGGRIPKSYHTMADGTLCLGAPLAVAMTFVEHPTLVDFVEKQMIPYFYTFSYHQKHKKQMPYGELAHGGTGLLSYYRDIFKVSSDSAVIIFLNLLSKRYRGHLDCPCGSGKRLRNCHGQQILQMQEIMPKEHYEYELKLCMDSLKPQKRR